MSCCCVRAVSMEQTLSNLVWSLVSGCLIRLSRQTLVSLKSKNKWSARSIRMYLCEHVCMCYALSRTRFVIGKPSWRLTKKSAPRGIGWIFWWPLFISYFFLVTFVALKWMQVYLSIIITTTTYLFPFGTRHWLPCTKKLWSVRTI